MILEENEYSKYNEFRLPVYNGRSPYDSNCIEFFAPITDQSVPGVIPGRYWISTFGRIWNNNRQNFMHYSMHMKGYWQAQFRCLPGCGGASGSITRKIHRLIMTTFMYFEGCEEYEVNHIDGCKTNNIITNLEWCTHSENTIHAINMGLKQIFGHDYQVRLNNDQVKQIYELAALGYKAEEIMDIMDIHYVSIELVSNMVRGNSRRPDSMKD